MSLLTARGVNLYGNADRSRRRGPSPVSRRRRFRLRTNALWPILESLEDLTLLSASIVGTVWSDPSGSGTRTPGSEGLSGQTVYLDLNHDHQLDGTTTTISGSTTFAPSPGALGALTGADMASLTAQGLPSRLSDLTVTMDLANNGTSPVQIAVVSPTGLNVPDLPVLFTIQPGEHFVGSFNQHASTPVTLAPRPLAPGAYIPQQLFTLPAAHVYDSDPNGTWGLVFFGDDSALALKSWSITFTSAEPTAQTDANGNYSFNDLAPGTYSVTVQPPSGADQTSPSGGAPQVVTIADGQSATGIDFGVQPASDLVSQSFSLAAAANAWGQPITIDYTLANKGSGDAPGFDVALNLLSNTPNTPPVLLQNVHVNGLARNTTVSGSLTVQLPAAPPPGFNSLSDSFVGFLIDPADALAHNNAADRSLHELGVDEAPLAVSPNEAVATGSGVQQMPSIAVDPNDPEHLVVADMDSTLVTTGYEGIGVSVSHDGGKTWQRTSIPLPSGFEQGAASPTAQFDGRGRVFVSFMAATFLGPVKPTLTNPDSTQRLLGFTSDNGIFVAASSDGGLTWGTPVAVETHVYDPTTQTPVPFDFSPSLAVDTFKTLSNGSPNPNYGNLYITWVRAYPRGQFPGHAKATGGTDIMFAASTNSGSSWSLRTQTDANNGLTVSAIRDPNWGEDGDIDPGRGYSLYPQISIGPGGDIYVSSFEGNDFAVFYSTDAGTTFRTPDRNQQYGVPFYGLLNNAYGSLLNDSFRTNPVRDIVADPSHPGRVYVVEANTVVSQVTGNPIDAGEVVFAYSNDYGLTWQTIFQVGNETTNLADLAPGQNDAFLSVLNDDNNGRDTAFDTAQQLTIEVISGQVLPSMAVDAQGRLTVIWYDTRRDPLGVNLDVFGTVSTDGGQTFTPNFRLTDTSFDPNNGAFTDAQGRSNDYLGDRIGVVAANGVAYAVWTDTRNGSQDVYLQRYDLSPAPAPPTDRLAPNSTPQTATNLGQVSAQLLLPSLVASPGNDGWFRLQAGATGELVASATASADGPGLQIELTDASGNPLPAVVTPVLDASGAVVGTQVVYPSVAGQTYLVRVAGSFRITYSLAVDALTADLGTSVEGSRSGSLAPGDQAVYRLEAAVDGSLALTLTPGADTQGNLVLQILSADGQTVLGSGPSGGTSAGVAQSLGLAVARGQVVLIEVTGADSGSQGDYALGYTNLDQYETPGAPSLFLPTTGQPGSVAVANLSDQPTPDIIVSSTGKADPLDVLTGNNDGTFQAPRQFRVGPGLSTASEPAGSRQVVVADFNHDGYPDVVVPNFRAGDLSVLLGNGDGTFQPQRRFDAVPSPDAVVAGDFNGDGNTDLAVLQSFPLSGSALSVAILTGRGDGTFKPAVSYPTRFTEGAGPMVVGDFTGSGHDDVIVFSAYAPVGQLFIGNGDGTLRDAGVFSTGEPVLGAEAVNLGDGKLSLIVTGENSGNVYVIHGNGDGTFQSPQAFLTMAPRAGDNVSVTGLAVVGFPSTFSGSVRPASSAVVSGQPGIYVTAASRSGAGAAELLYLPAELDAQNHFQGFGAAQVQGQVGLAGKIAAFEDNGQLDVVAADNGGVRVFSGLPFGQSGGSSSSGTSIPANNTLQTARDLGSATHLITLPQTIVQEYEDVYYTFHVPTEPTAGSAAEVVDFSALFADLNGAGLQMQVLSSGGQVLGSGDRIRIQAAQGAVLTIHLFGQVGSDGIRGSGVYTLDVDVLPQVVSAQAVSLLPGGLATSLVLTLEGDQLDPGLAENPANYAVTWLGPNGDQVIPIEAADGGMPVVYTPAANAEVTSGLYYTTSTRQTITLLFAEPLPAGSYRITLSPDIQAATFQTGEASTLAESGSIGGHPLVSVAGGSITDGPTLVVADLVSPSGTPASLGSIVDGSLFLSQLQSDLMSLLYDGVRLKGDDPAITQMLNDEVLSHFAPMFKTVGPTAPGAPSPTIAAVWFDPVSIDLQSPQGQSLSYNLGSNQVSNGLGQTFVSVGGNVELVVLANAAGTFNLDVANVPAAARGGAVELSAGGIQSIEFTGALRADVTSFQLNLGETTGAGTTGTAGGESSGGSGSSGAGGTNSGGALTAQAAATLISTVVLGTPIAPRGSSSSASASNASSGEATAETASAQATTAVTQSLSNNVVAQGTSNGTGQPTAEQLAANGLAALRPALRSSLRLVTRLMSRLNGVIDAMGMKQRSSALRVWGRLLENLLQQEQAGDGEDALLPIVIGAGGTSSASAAPATPSGPAPAASKPGPIHGVLRDQGAARLFHDRQDAATAQLLGAPAGPDAYCALAFLASGLHRSGIRNLSRAKVSLRKLRPEETESPDRDEAGE